VNKAVGKYRHLSNKLIFLLFLFSTFYNKIYNYTKCMFKILQFYYFINCSF